MKTIQIWLLLLLVACSTNNRPTTNEDFKIGYTANVFQFAGTDSTHKKLAEKIVFYRNGKVASDQYLDFKLSVSDGFMPATYSFFYSDTMLVKEIRYTVFDDDTVKIIYDHDAMGKRTHDTYFDYHYRVKKEFEHMDNLIKEFYDTIKTWKKIAETVYRYDQLGRNTEWIRTDTDSKNEDKKNRFTYDVKGNISTHHSYSYGKLESQEKFSYSQNLVTCETMSLSDSSVWQKFTHLNERGQVIEESFDDKGTIFISSRHTYDQFGRRKKSITFEDGIPFITTLYEYSSIERK